MLLEFFLFLLTNSEATLKKYKHILMETKINLDTYLILTRAACTCTLFIPSIQTHRHEHALLTLVLLNLEPAFANSVDPGQLASEEANWSGSTLFVN